MSHGIASSKGTDVSLNASDLSSRCPALTEMLGRPFQWNQLERDAFVNPSTVYPEPVSSPLIPPVGPFSSSSSPLVCVGPTTSHVRTSVTWQLSGTPPPAVVLWQAPSVLLLLISLHTKTRQWSSPTTTPPLPHFTHSTFRFFFPHLGPCFVSAPSLGGPRRGNCRKALCSLDPPSCCSAAWRRLGGGGGKPLYSVCSVCHSKQAEFWAKMFLCSYSWELLLKDESYGTNGTLESIHLHFMRWMFPQ